MLSPRHPDGRAANAWFGSILRWQNTQPNESMQPTVLYAAADAGRSASCAQAAQKLENHWGGSMGLICRCLTRTALAAATALTVSDTVLAQPYPSKPVKI